MTTVAKKTVVAKRTAVPGVVILRNIPDGFDEAGMRSYFTQFGRVTRLRLSVSRKTGRSREYAYIEFASEAVARIVADAMNNYLMFEKLVKCKFIPADQVNPGLFEHLHKPFISSVQRHKQKVNALHTYEQERRAVKRKLTGIHKAEKRLADLGINFKCVIVNDPKLKPIAQDKVVVDSEDDDIQFRTPPTARKVKKQKVVPSAKLKAIDDSDDSVPELTPMKKSPQKITTKSVEKVKSVDKPKSLEKRTVPKSDAKKSIIKRTALKLEPQTPLATPRKSTRKIPAKAVVLPPPVAVKTPKATKVKPIAKSAAKPATRAAKPKKPRKSV